MNHTPRPLNPNLFIFLMGFIGVTSIMASNMYVAVLPELVHYFDSTRTVIKLSLTTCVLGIFFGEIISGPSSDVFGKRIILIIFSSIFILSTLSCAITTNVYIFLFMRFIQGFGAGAGAILVHALASENFSGKKYYKVITSIVLMLSIAHGLAQAVGGGIGHHFEWQALFYFLTILGIISLIICIFLKYDLKKPTGNYKAIYTEMFRLTKHPTFISYTLIFMLSLSSMFTFSLLSSFLFRIEYGWAPNAFIGIGITIGLGHVGGVFLLRKLSASRSLDTLILPGVLISFIASALLTVLTLITHLTGIAVLCFAFFYFFGVGMTMCATNSQTLLLSEDYKGLTSSLIGSTGLLGTSIITAIVAHIHNSLLNLSLSLFLLATLGLVVLSLTRPRKKT